MPFSWKILYFSHLGLVKKSLNAKLRNLYILYTKGLWGKGKPREEVLEQSWPPPVQIAHRCNS